ncbi:DUF6266 family protein [Pedobacter sp. AW31-3R]|uniref:DUF6266 family protein n=1 Tax=Pedobacter sp. AW31-3R TaxID=3445781 RepID=UPI003FA0299C
MASRKTNTTGSAYKGKVGPVLMTTWMNLEIIKSLPRKRRRAVQSSEQTAQHDKFSLVREFLRMASNVIKIGYQQPKNKCMTPMNMACSYHMTGALLTEDDNSFIDLALVKFSKPIWLTQQVWNPQVKAEEGRRITITWELNPYPNKDSEPDDRVYIVLCDKNIGECVAEIFAGTRETGSYSATATSIQIGHEFACYLFVASQDGKLVSETDYLGMVTILK